MVLEEGLIAASAQVSVSARGLLVCCLGTTGMPPSPLGWPHVQGAALPTAGILSPPAGCGRERDCEGLGPGRETSKALALGRVCGGGGM